MKHTKYSRQEWRCDACDVEGFVLLKDSDTHERILWRIRQSHRAQRKSDRCRHPRLSMLARKARSAEAPPK
jgi:hypothetical protein